MAVLPISNRTDSSLGMAPRMRVTPSKILLQTLDPVRRVDLRLNPCLIVQIGEVGFVGRILRPSSKTAVILTPFLTKCLPLFPGSLHRIAAIPRTEELPQILGRLSLVAVAHAAQQIAFQMRRTALQRGSGKDRTDDILQTLQPVGTHQADLPNASFLQLCEHLAPAQGALRGFVEDSQHFTPACLHARRALHRKLRSPRSACGGSYVDAIDEDDRVIRLQRAREPLRDIFSEVVQHPRNARLAVVLAIDILEYLADLFLRKTFRVKRSRKAFAFIFLMAKDCQNPGMKIPVAISRYPEHQCTAMTVTMSRKPLHLFPDAEFSRRYSRRSETIILSNKISN